MLAARAGWVHTPLDVDAMRDAIACLIGEHDFSSFRAADCQSKTPVKHLYQIDIREQGDFIHFRFRANAFLHHMVRNLMGCLVAIGRGRHPVVVDGRSARRPRPRCRRADLHARRPVSGRGRLS